MRPSAHPCRAPGSKHHPAARRPLLPVGLGVLLAGLALLAGEQPAHAAEGVRPNTADYLEVSGAIDPAVSTFLERQLRAADRDGTGAVLLQLDTPGALDTSVEPVLDTIAEIDVPVIVWVAPGDAQAASAGALLLLAADHAVATDRATLGPLQPLDLRDYGEDPSGVDRYSDRFDPELIEALRTRVLPAGQGDRLPQGLVDSLAPNLQELLLSLRGMQIDSPSGTVILSDEPLELRFMKMSLLERLTHAATQPGYAYLLLVLGLFGLLFELYNPGVGGAALFGGILLAFGLYALTLLPTSWIAVAGVILAFALLTADLRTMSFGFLSWAGLAVLAVAGYMMYPGAHPALAMPWWAPPAGVILTAIFFVQVMTSAIKARTAKPIAGSGLVDAVGVARTDIAPEGQVMARGTLWRARTLGMAIAQGSAVKVLGISGLMLMVEPTDETPDEQDRAGSGNAEISGPD